MESPLHRGTHTPRWYLDRSTTTCSKAMQVAWLQISYDGIFCYNPTETVHLSRFVITLLCFVLAWD